LQEANVSSHIVPGITSAAAAAAEIGASLTTRGRNKSVSLITGHDAEGFADHDWKAAKRSTPVTVVENASRPNQIIVATTLEQLADDIQMRGIKGPAILLLGYAPREALSAVNNIGVAI